MTFLRWLCVAALVHVGTVAYACLLGLAMLGLSRAGMATALDRDLAEPLLQPLLWQAFQWGSFAGIFLGPTLGISVLRDVNESLERPQDDRRWWKRAHTYALLWFGVIAGFGILVGGFYFAAALAGGSTGPEIRAMICTGLFWGHLLGAFGAVMGAISVRVHRRE